MNTKPLKGVGERLPLVDGIEKVTGHAKYTADLFPPDALVGKIYRSPLPHAELIEVDVSAARQLPGVVAVITGEDCDVPYGILPIAQNEFPLARGKVRYFGEPVAAVAAIDEETADRALKLIRLHVRELPIIETIAQARAPGAALLHDNKPGNIEREVHNEFGDTTAGFAAADLVREQTYHTAEVNHAQMEPHAAFAAWDPLREQLTLHTCSMVPYYVHKRVAQCLGIDTAQVRVIKPFVGGAFGARVETLNFEIVISLLARAAKGTVRMQLTREECMLTHRGRPESDTRVKLGMARDGRITACECEVVQRGGAYAGYGIITILYAGALINGLYDLPAVKYDGYRIYSNTPPCGAMRGHGTVNTRIAFESLMTSMAIELGLDPIEVRRRNLLPCPTETLNGLRVESYGLPECLDKVEEASGWRQRRGKMPKWKGIGMACSHFVSGSAKPVHFTGEPHATIVLKLDFDGGISILSGAADVGQGSTTIVAQVVVEVLGVDWRRVRVITNDSAVTPKDNGSYSSRVTFMVGNACLDAANKLKQILVEAAARRLQVAPDQVECMGESYQVAGDPSRAIGFGDAAAEALVDTGTLHVKGTFTCPVEFQGGKHRGGAVGSTMGFSYAAQAVEVTVDPVTGRVSIDKVWAALDCGYAINPLSVEGQVQGAVFMGMGQGLSEQTRYENGKHAAANFLEYGFPTIAETPPIEVFIVESIDPNGPFGAKEASEGPLAGFPAALADAVREATGLELTDFPLTPERIAEALEARERAGRAAQRKAAKQSATEGAV